MRPSQTTYSCQSDICPGDNFFHQHFWTKIFLATKMLLDLKYFYDNNLFHNQNLFFGQKTFLDQNCFWAKIIFGLQILVGLQLGLDPNILGLKLLKTKFFSFHKSWIQNFYRFFAVNIFLRLKRFFGHERLFRSRFLLTQNLRDKKERSN